MENTMLGLDVAKAMKEHLIADAESLKENGIHPTLTIIRVGAKEEDLSYERGAKKRMELIGIDCNVVELPEQISQNELEKTFQAVNEDECVHGILLFQPLPDHLDVEPLKKMIHPLKDVDGMSMTNMAKVFAGEKDGFAPCTAEAVMEMLAYNNVELSGKRVTIVGRSLVVGKPLSMLMLQKNATVTVCHSRTKELEETCRNAEVLVAAVGRPRMITADMVGEGAVVVDVGINVDENGMLCGDVEYEGAKEKAALISPVPRGVGSVTTSVLAKHVILGAKYQNGMED